MKSMTGYAKKQCNIGNKIVNIEIKTLNSKTLDVNIKVPIIFHSKEMEMRTMLNTLIRGKIEVLITMDNAKDAPIQLNEEILKSRYHALVTVAEELHCPQGQIFESLIGQTDIWGDRHDEELTEEDWSIVKDCFEHTVEEVEDFRKHEGDVLEQDFVKHVDLIEAKLNEIPQFENERIETAKSRIKKYFEECAIKEIDTNRFEQELIYYLEKLDITEEKVRLAKHIAYFRATMGEEGCGKKLGFVAQEMGREINTTGSKANHVEIQKRVVEMKDELEKIKEQLGNIL